MALTHHFLQIEQTFSGERAGCIKQLSATELRRRLCHMTPGVIALLIVAIPHQHRLSLSKILGLISLILVGGLLVRYVYPTIARERETDWSGNIVRYCLPSALLLALLPSHPEFAVVCITIVAFGDGSATLFGILFGQRTLPWNHCKTWAGCAGFICCATPMATLGFWLEAEPSVSIAAAAFCSLLAALCGVVAESLPFESSDNLRVGTAALVGVILGHVLAIGPVI